MSYPIRPVADRFWEKVGARSADGCWPWLGAIGGHGYGTFMVDGRRRKGRASDLAHRVAWQLCRGPIPPGMHVLHRCDNRRCVRPEHLFLGTNADNIADRVAKGRSVHMRGERSGRARLTADQVRSIRQLLDRGETQIAIAQRFGVSRGAISAIRHGANWRHVA